MYPYLIIMYELPCIIRNLYRDILMNQSLSSYFINPMYSTLRKSTTSHPNKSNILLQFTNIECTIITHTRLYSLSKLIQYQTNWLLYKLFNTPANGMYPSTPSGVNVVLPGSLAPVRIALDTLAPYPAIPRYTFRILPSLYISFDGLSSHPATNLPNITQSAPAANALHIFPLFLFPPSDINGTSYFLQIGATSNNALNYGTPHPLTTRVMQIDPLPIPHLIPSAPALINASAPSPVAIDPATTSISGNSYLSFCTALIARLECPLATSNTSTSHPAWANSIALSNSSGVAPTAAPTSSYPYLSLFYMVYTLSRSKSFKFTKPRMKLSCTTGSFSIL